MPPVEWYHARGNKQMGPVSAAELKRLAAAGDLHPDDLVWREGLNEWAPAKSVRGLFEDEAKPTVAEELPSQPVLPVAKPLAKDVEPETHVPTPKAVVPRPPAWHLMDLLLDSLRSDFNARFVDTTARIFRTCGLYALLLAMVVTAVFAVVVAMKSNTLGNLLWGVMMLLLLAALQYVAGKSCDALDRLGRATNGTLTSTALPDCFALLSLVAGLVALFGSVPMAVSILMYPLILLGIAGFIICVYLAFVALNPSTLNISIVSEETHASEEAIRVLVFLQKVFMRSVPVALGTGVMAGTLMMGYACYEAFSGPTSLLSAQSTAAAARSTLIFSAVLPLAAYLLFLLSSLLLDIWRAILTLPGKLDELAEMDYEKKSGH